MAQLLVLIVVLAIGSVVQADVKMMGQPMACNTSKTITSSQTMMDSPLIDFSLFRIENGVFQGSFKVLYNITTATTSTVTYTEKRNGNKYNEFTETKSVCKNGTADDPQANLVKRFMEKNPNSQGCLPALKAGTYDMRNVTVQQANLKDLSPEATYSLDITLRQGIFASCITINAVSAPDT